MLSPDSFCNECYMLISRISREADLFLRKRSLSLSYFQENLMAHFLSISYGYVLQDVLNIMHVGIHGKIELRKERF